MQATTDQAATTAQQTQRGGAQTVKRGCHLVTPYRAGFEDLAYDRTYDNPFPPFTVEWLFYDQGQQDARIGGRLL